MKSLGLKTALCAGLLAGCAAEDRPELVGVATAEVQLAPTSVKCVNVRVVNGATTINTAFNVVPGGSTAFALSGLPIGNDTFTAQAYSVICASIGGATATYVSDSSTMAVSSTPVIVTLTMRPASGGTGSAVVNFPKATGLITDYFPAGSLPTTITLGPDGNLWFGQNGANRIGMIVPPYGWLYEYSISGNAEALTAGPDGNVWFAERTINYLGRVNPMGDVTEFFVPTGGAGVSKITSGPDGNVWFTERSGNKIGRISPLTATFAEFPLPNPTSAPNGIAAGSDGNVWFTEDIGNRIGRITPAGAITEFAVPTAFSSPEGIAAGPDGNLWFIERNANKIGRISTAGAITEFTIPSPSSGPVEITAGPDGNLWFTDANLNLITRVTTAGAFTKYPAPLSYPWGITAGPDGAIWFTVYSYSRIGRMSI